MAAFDHGTASLTADSQKRNQPNTSRILCGIEEQVGFKLFERRGHRGLRPTLLGTLVVGHARTILHDMDEADRDLNELRAKLEEMAAKEE